MGKFGKILILAIVVLLLAILMVQKRAGYKVCPGCSAREYFQRGLDYSCKNEKDYPVIALKFIKHAAEKGEFRAKLLLAELFLQKFPEGYIPVFKKPVTCLAKLATPDRKAAISYYQQVIEDIVNQKEVPENLFLNVYFLYKNGILPADKPQEAAQKWLIKAAEAGSHAAMVLLAKAADARGDLKLARKWLEKASGDPTDWYSALMLGDYFFYGKGVPVDYKQAEVWYQKSLQAAQKLASDLESEQEKMDLEMAPRVRLDIVRQRLAQEKGGPGSGLEYKLEGSVKEYQVYVKGPSKEFQLAGKVTNKNGKIIAELNKKIQFASPPETTEKEGFSSMVDGVKWILDAYASHMKGEKASKQ